MGFGELSACAGLLIAQRDISLECHDAVLCMSSWHLERDVDLSSSGCNPEGLSQKGHEADVSGEETEGEDALLNEQVQCNHTPGQLACY